MGEVEVITYVVLSVWGVYIIYLVFELFFDTKNISIKQKIVMFGIYNIVTDLVYLKYNIPMLTLGINLISLILIGYIYTKNIKQTILPLMLILLVIASGEGISLSIVKLENFYFFEDNPLVSIEIILLARVTTHFIVLTLRHLKNIKLGLQIPIKQHIVMIGISGMSLYVGLLLIGYREINMLLRTVGIVGMVAINTAIFYLYNMVNRYLEEQMVKMVYQKESQYYYNQSLILSKSLEKNHQIRHDIKTNLQNIQFFIKKGECQEASEYIESIEGHYKEKAEISKTGITIIDSILNYKLGEAEEQSIDYTLNIDIPNTFSISNFDIGVVLDNMLNNAIEALLKLPKNERKLKINIIYKMKALKIEVGNSYNGNINLKNNQILTTKTNSINHGQGLKIICSIAEKHGDYINVDHSENWFEISVLLLDNQP